MNDVGSVQGNPGGGLAALEGARARTKRAPKGNEGGGGIAQRILNHFDQQGVTRRTVTSTAQAVTQHLYGPRATREDYHHVFNRIVNLLKSQEGGNAGVPQGARILDTLA